MDPQVEYPAPASPPPVLRRKPLLIAVAVTVLALCAAIAYGGVSWAHRDEDQISRTVEKFAHVADREDTATMISMLCAEEAQSVTDNDDSSGGSVLGPDHERPIKVSKIRITGDVAQARVTRPGQQPATLYLRKEAGTWKLCDPERDTGPP